MALLMPQLPALAPLPEIGVPVEVEGWAVKAGAGADRIAFRKYAGLGFIPWKMPPLYFRHDNSRTVGTVTELRWQDEGLWVTAIVTDPAAAICPAFSVAASVTASAG
jgi:hypothetical protein